MDNAGSNLSFILGAMATLLGSAIAAFVQWKIAAINAKKDRDLKDNERLAEARHEDVQFRRRKLEELHVIMPRLSMHHSLTSSTMESMDEMSIQQFHIKHNENQELADTACMIADLYYPDLSGRTHEIRGQMNMYWGY